MNRRLSLVLLLALPASPSVLLAASEATAVASSAALEWLQKVDTANYSGSWQSAASMFKAAVSVQAWEQAVQSVRAPLGALRKRVEKSTKATSTLPGAPDGQYVVIQYDTAFEGKAAAVETVIVSKDRDGFWRVAGYFIK